MNREIGVCLDLEAKAISDEGEFEGYASTFGNSDLHGQAVIAGAFTKSLGRRPAGKVKMLRDHDSAEPIGVWTELKEDGRGLRAKGRLILETLRGRETHALMKAGALDSLSIGYRTIKDTIDQAKKVRLLHEVDLLEISVVTFPANPKAAVQAVKGNDPDRARELVRAIQRATEALTRT